MPRHQNKNVIGGGLLLVGLTAGGLFGYSIAAVNEALRPLNDTFTLTGLAHGALVSGLLMGALLGCVTAGRLAARYGRRSLLVWSGLLATAGSVVAAAAPTLETVIAGRLILGFAVGVTTSVAPVLIAELSPADRRGSLIACYQLAVTVAVLAAFAIGSALAVGGHWRLMLAINGLPGLLQAGAVLVVVPPWMGARHPRVDTSTAPGRAPTETVGLVRSLRDPSLRRPVIVACGAALMSACVGVGAVTYYSTFVFAIAGFQGRGSAEVASLTVGAVNVVATVVGMWLIRRFRRKALLSAGLTGIAVSLAVAAWSLWASVWAPTGPVTVAALLAFMACYAFSVGPIGWLLVAEVLPHRIRDRMAATATGMNWSANLLIALLFPLAVGAPGDPARVGAAFLLFSIVSLGFLAFTHRCVPETRNRSLTALEAELTAGAVREAETPRTPLVLQRRRQLHDLRRRTGA
ncbi:MFS transporter [Streptomyces sp. TRM72054]|uniref:MFS transporter n=1 Tax=Streptomyces sp. TRM72054 TaxID=2870562 RepID=UPI001C8CE0F2|nr:MFS transporter [Streptomyces sp. TRM72054]MBX9394399.1 MFS transporter [Streptomyces sp. TRM72054]